MRSIVANSELLEDRAVCVERDDGVTAGVRVQVRESLPWFTSISSSVQSWRRSETVIR
jgi:hypothetical protein